MREKYWGQQNIYVSNVCLTAVMFVVRRRVLYDAGSAVARVHHAQDKFSARDAAVETTNYALSMLTSAAGVGPPSTVKAAAHPITGVSPIVVGAQGEPMK